MFGYKTFHRVRILPGDIEPMHMIVKGRRKRDGSGQTPAEQFYFLIK